MSFKEGDHIIARVDGGPDRFVGLIHGIVDQKTDKKGERVNFSTLMTIEIKGGIGVTHRAIRKITPTGYILLKYGPGSNIKFICFYSEEAWNKLEPIEEKIIKHRMDISKEEMVMTSTSVLYTVREEDAK